MTEATQAVEAEAVAEAAEAVEAPTLTLHDLTLTANIIDLSVQRGAFKGAEAEQVGQMFNRLVAIIKSIAPPAAEEDAAEVESEGEG
jgi:hypothetical protein|tara:strand:+ start:2446 stop:2706 length:261 start_codon:yes stop_codon:yes gene_type:complete